MDDDFFTIRDRLRRRYVVPATRRSPAEPPHGEALASDGFLTEIAGRVILTAPAHSIKLADELPAELAERWEKAAAGNPYMMWLQGRFVEAEKANRNGAFWSTEDLQFGEMTVRNGPLNWLHEERTVVGTIADNALIRPQAQLQEAASWQVPGYTFNGQSMTYTNSTSGMVVRAADMLQRADLFSAPQPRPYIAAVSAVWKWVHPEKVQAIQAAADEGRLYYSMECIAREMSCVSDETHVGCNKSFDYYKAMTEPTSTCEHIQARSSARRLVDPAFLGGAVIVPPVQPGWGSANVEVMKAAMQLAEQTEAASGEMTASQWEALMGEVVRFATS